MNYQEALTEFNIKKSLSLDELAKAYKNLAKIRHPDMGGTNQSFQRLYQAYKLLSKTDDSMPQFHTVNNSENFKSSVSISSFKQVLNLKIKFIFGLCYLFNIKILTYCGYNFIQIKEKLIILSTLPIEHSVNFKMKKYSKVINPKLGLNKLEKKLYILFL